MYSLAIETSTHHGSITLARGDCILRSTNLAQSRRHNLNLIPSIADLFDSCEVCRADLAEVYVSIGPGSFTGLRVGVATAQTLCHALGCRTVAVPTLDVIVENAPTDRGHVAVCHAPKGDHLYASVYQYIAGQWQAYGESGPTTKERICGQSPRPLLVLGDSVSALDWPADVETLDERLAVPRSDVVWRLGRDRSLQHQFTEPFGLLPLYARRPEAEELWEQRQASRN